ncbi:MAG: bacillithiol biosynthesis deacetylase BshB1 [Saprospiraceae bacterium]|nr:bacillithiol biosynthesis deacetylase BshB1 [Saprospiraceae bacterium]
MVAKIKQVEILAIGVHPDDVELSCSGTLLKHKDLGYQFGILDLTLGELGTRGSAEIRTLEAMSAAEFMGAEFRHQLNLGDGFFQNEEKNILQIIPIIRAAQPKIVLANAIEDRHPDHARASRLIADACFLAGLHRIKTELNGQPQNAYRPSAIYNYTQDYYLPPDVVVDISEYMDKKLEAIRCFKSQFYNPNSSEPESAISGKEFFDEIIAKSRVSGRVIGGRFGESFTVNRPIGVHNLLMLQ